MHVHVRVCVRVYIYIYICIYILFISPGHNGYLCEPAIVYSFDVTDGNYIYDESRDGNDGIAFGQFGIDGKEATLISHLLIH